MSKLSTKELLELAAQAAGLDYAREQYRWNPLEKAKDTFELQVKLGITVNEAVTFRDGNVMEAGHKSLDFTCTQKYVSEDTKLPAAMAAIVRVAAELELRKI